MRRIPKSLRVGLFIIRYSIMKMNKKTSLSLFVAIVFSISLLANRPGINTQDATAILTYASAAGEIEAFNEEYDNTQRGVFALCAVGTSKCADALGACALGLGWCPAGWIAGIGFVTATL